MEYQDLNNVTVNDLNTTLKTLVEIRTLYLNEKWDIDMINMLSASVELIEKAIEYKEICREYHEGDTGSKYERAMSIVGK